MSGEAKLSKAEYAELLKSERTLLDKISEYDKAEKCGIDCQQLREMSDNALGVIQNLKANFAPSGM